ncbi:MAG TPA: hypothetical protein EYP10_02865 [Armatimonadetes bacterium]|nr:hypothetical protein [Armatimonadota bacterium]
MPMSAVELDERILAFIKSGEGSFEQLAFDVFEYQFANNEPYRQYCMRLNVTPDNVHHWKQIPAVPALAFKFFDLACEPPNDAPLIFLSSGTTQGAHARSKHYVFNPELYRASACEWFKRHVLPDDVRLPFLILFPPWDEMRTSSLAYMLDMVACEFGSDDSAHFVHDGMLMVEQVVRRLMTVDSPVCLLGTSLAFYELLDYCHSQQLRFQLPTVAG